MDLDIHPFKCRQCNGNRPHRLLKTFDCPDVPDSPPEVWLVECQGCFEQRIIYPAERVMNKEDDIARCDQCGNWKMKSIKCRVCKMVANNEQIMEKYWTGGQTLERPVADL